LGLGQSTVKEHCDVLRKANLIEQIDEGRKWKYYELTTSGRNVITPNLYDELRVLITLCIGALVFSGIIFSLVQAPTSISPFSTSSTITTEGFSDSTFPSSILEESSEVQAVDSQISETGVDSSEVTKTPTIEKTVTITNIIKETTGISAQLLAIAVALSLIAGIILGFIAFRKH